MATELSPELKKLKEKAEEAQKRFEEAAAAAAKAAAEKKAKRIEALLKSTGIADLPIEKLARWFEHIATEEGIKKTPKAEPKGKTAAPSSGLSTGMKAGDGVAS
ncbi:hypothetical protein ABH944_008558 [Caballeronia udeis]|uniref:Uncharacterized protein n=1 Tax=Caballeronia udeis TaxID=1232866 RepID=A0ABW8MXP3_9BURK